MTDGEAEAAVERAVARIEAFRSSTGALKGSPAAEVIPEPEEAGTKFGVNSVWLELARRATREARQGSKAGPRVHANIKT